MSQKRLTIGLLFHTFGHGNLGIDALARGHVVLLGRAAKKVNVALGFLSLGSDQRDDVADLPEDVAIGPAPRIKDLLRFRFDFLKAVRGCDAVFDIGEGDSFTDIYGWRRYLVHLLAKTTVIVAGTPLLLAPQTIGPFNNRWRRRMAVMLMRKAARVYTRDGLSTAFLKDNHVFDNIDEFIDVAFSLPYVRQEKAKDRVRVAINTSGLLYNGGYTGKNELGMFLDYKRFTHELFRKLASRPDVEIHLICHVHGSDGTGVDNDAPVMRELAEQYPTAVVAPLFESSEQAKSYISGMNFMVAGRMHACIAAFSAGVPVVPIAYSRKFNGLFDTLRYPHYVDGRAETNDAALKRTVSAFENRAVLASEIEVSLKIADERLTRYLESLVDVLKGLCLTPGPSGQLVGLSSGKGI